MLTMYTNILTVIRYRWLLYELVTRDLKLRYRGSVLGVVWTLLNPLLFMSIYTLVFAIYLKTNVPNFPLFLLSGLIPWYWISNGVGQAVTSIVDGRTYVGKTLLPPELLVLVPVLSNGVNFLITVALLFPVALALKVNPLWALLFLLPLVLIELLIVLGVSFLAATFNVFFRDLQQLIGYALMAVMFLTPIFYVRSVIPMHLQFLVKYSPFAALISGYQDVFYYGVPPDWRQMLFAAVFGILVLGIALGCFNRYSDAFGEYV
jgi:lipopolysaccharide transport system permease protein